MNTFLFHALSLGAALLSIPLARAHFPILIHDAALGATNGPVSVTFAVGHPFELEFEAAPHPDRLGIIDPHGRSTNLTSKVRQAGFRGDAKVAAWQVAFEPARGDSLIALDTAPAIDEAQRSEYREFVKTYVHRGLEEGWTRRSGQPVEIVPLTRPYGLKPGMVFSGRLLRGDAPVAATAVHFERLSPEHVAPDAIPVEPLVTFTVLTDADGRFVISLPDPGWWVVGAYVEDLGTVKREGRDYRIEGFAGLWLRVEPR